METTPPKVPAIDTAKALQYPEDTRVPRGLHLQIGLGLQLAQNQIYIFNPCTSTSDVLSASIISISRYYYMP